jgi:hypothetical protein
VLRVASPPEAGEHLPYRVELRDADNGGAVERVLARAANISLAHAIFKAARASLRVRQGNAGQRED